MNVERILLIDVEFDKRANDQSQLQTRWSHHPLGLMYLAAAVNRRFPGIDFRILHTVTCDNADASIVTLLDEFRPNLVGLRALSLFQKQFAAAARLVRQRCPGVFLIGGGPYCSASYEDVVGRGLVDLVVHEEGEVTFTELVAHLQEHAALPTTLPGTVVKLEDQVRFNRGRQLIENLDELPFPNYDLIQLGDYQGFSNHAFQSASHCAFVETSRGCPYKCFYCHVANVKTVRRRSPASVVEEMEGHYYSRDVRDFVIVDDIFNVPLRTAKDILRLLAARLPGIRMNFPNGLRADQMDDEFLDLLEACGTVHLALAIETATPRLQKLSGKMLKLDQATHMVGKASRRFITCGFFMIGFPTETIEEARETIRYAKDFTYLVQPVLSIVRVYPGTPLFTALDATEEQARRLEQQTAEACQPRLAGDPTFYGDMFSDEQVPLKAEHIRELRWEWLRNVVNNPTRVRNSHEVLTKHFDSQRTIEFYRNFFDNSAFDQKRLDRMLRTAVIDLGKHGNAATADRKVAAHLG